MSNDETINDRAFYAGLPSELRSTLCTDLSGKYISYLLILLEKVTDASFLASLNLRAQSTSRKGDSPAKDLCRALQAVLGGSFLQKLAHTDSTESSMSEAEGAIVIVTAAVGSPSSLGSFFGIEGEENLKSEAVRRVISECFPSNVWLTCSALQSCVLWLTLDDVVDGPTAERLEITQGFIAKDFKKAVSVLPMSKIVGPNVSKEEFASITRLRMSNEASSDVKEPQGDWPSSTVTVDCVKDLIRRMETPYQGRETQEGRRKLKTKSRTRSKITDGGLGSEKEEVKPSGRGSRLIAKARTNAALTKGTSAGQHSNLKHSESPLNFDLSDAKPCSLDDAVSKVRSGVDDLMASLVDDDGKGPAGPSASARAAVAVQGLVEKAFKGVIAREMDCKDLKEKSKEALHRLTTDVRRELLERCLEPCQDLKAAHHLCKQADRPVFGWKCAVQVLLRLYISGFSASSGLRLPATIFQDVEALISLMVATMRPIPIGGQSFFTKIIQPTFGSTFATDICLLERHFFEEDGEGELDETAASIRAQQASLEVIGETPGHVGGEWQKPENSEHRSLSWNASSEAPRQIHRKSRHGLEEALNAPISKIVPSGGSSYSARSGGSEMNASAGTASAARRSSSLNADFMGRRFANASQFRMTMKVARSTRSKSGASRGGNADDSTEQRPKERSMKQKTDSKQFEDKGKVKSGENSKKQAVPATPVDAKKMQSRLSDGDVLRTPTEKAKQADGSPRVLMKNSIDDPNAEAIPNTTPRDAHRPDNLADTLNFRVMRQPRFDDGEEDAANAAAGAAGDREHRHSSKLLDTSILDVVSTMGHIESGKTVEMRPEKMNWFNSAAVPRGTKDVTASFRVATAQAQPLTLDIGRDTDGQRPSECHGECALDSQPAELSKDRGDGHPAEDDCKERAGDLKRNREVTNSEAILPAASAGKEDCGAVESSETRPIRKSARIMEAKKRQEGAACVDPQDCNLEDRDAGEKKQTASSAKDHPFLGLERRDDTITRENLLSQEGELPWKPNKPLRFPVDAIETATKPAKTKVESFRLSNEELNDNTKETSFALNSIDSLYPKDATSNDEPSCGHAVIGTDKKEENLEVSSSPADAEHKDDTKASPLQGSAMPPCLLTEDEKRCYEMVEESLVHAMRTVLPQKNPRGSPESPESGFEFTSPAMMHGVLQRNEAEANPANPSTPVDVAATPNVPDATKPRRTPLMLGKRPLGSGGKTPATKRGRLAGMNALGKVLSKPFSSPPTQPIIADMGSPAKPSPYSDDFALAVSPQKTSLPRQNASGKRRKAKQGSRVKKFSPLASLSPKDGQKDIGIDSDDEDNDILTRAAKGDLSPVNLDMQGHFHSPTKSIRSEGATHDPTLFSPSSAAEALSEHRDRTEASVERTSFKVKKKNAMFNASNDEVEVTQKVSPATDEKIAAPTITRSKRQPRRKNPSKPSKGLSTSKPAKKRPSRERKGVKKDVSYDNHVISDEKKSLVKPSDETMTTDGPVKLPKDVPAVGSDILFATVFTSPFLTVQCRVVSILDVKWLDEKDASSWEATIQAEPMPPTAGISSLTLTVSSLTKVSEGQAIAQAQQWVPLNHDHCTSSHLQTKAPAAAAPPLEAINHGNGMKQQCHDENMDINECDIARRDREGTDALAAGSDMQERKKGRSSLGGNETTPLCHHRKVSGPLDFSKVVELRPLTNGFNSVMRQRRHSMSYYTETEAKTPPLLASGREEIGLQGLSRRNSAPQPHPLEANVSPMCLNFARDSFGSLYKGTSPVSAANVHRYIKPDALPYYK